MYKNIIFDAYGTLLDIHTNEQNDACWEKLAELLRFYDVNYTAKSLKDTYFSSCELQMTQGRKNHKHPEVDVVAVFNHILQNKGKKSNKSLATHLAQAFRAMTTEKLRLYDGVEETLSKLKKAGKKLYVLSNSQEVFLKPELQKLKIDRYFHGMVFSSQVGYSKPEPAIFEHLLQKYKLAKSESIYVGNDVDRDIVGAKNARLDCLWIHTNQTKDKSLKRPPKYVVEDGDFCKIEQILVKYK